MVVVVVVVVEEEEEEEEDRGSLGAVGFRFGLAEKKQADHARSIFLIAVGGDCVMGTQLSCHRGSLFFIRGLAWRVGLACGQV